MKIFSHPVHMMLVHFPSAFLPAGFMASLMYYLTGNEYWALSGLYTTTAGVVMGWIAICFGLIDMLEITAQNHVATKLGWLHGSINGNIVIVFSVIIYRQWSAFPVMAMPTIGGLILKAILVLLLLVGNYLGGELILKYGIGFKGVKK